MDIHGKMRRRASGQGRDRQEPGQTGQAAIEVAGKELAIPGYADKELVAAVLAYIPEQIAPGLWAGCGPVGLGNAGALVRRYQAGDNGPPCVRHQSFLQGRRPGGIRLMSPPCGRGSVRY